MGKKAQKPPHGMSPHNRTSGPYSGTSRSGETDLQRQEADQWVSAVMTKATAQKARENTRELSTFNPLLLRWPHYVEIHRPVYFK